MADNTKIEWTDATSTHLFRVHFENPETAPLNLEATDAAEARKLASARAAVAPGAIRKVKIVRESINAR